MPKVLGESFSWNLNSMEIKKGGIMNSKEKQSARKEIREESSSRLRILLVEDDSDIRESLRMVLGEAYDLIGLSNGGRLLEMIDGHEPNLVILDINLPGEDGFELCRRIRSTPQHRHLPVMFLTARRDDASFVKSVDASADAYLNKPFQPRELIDTIQRLVDASASA